MSGRRFISTLLLIGLVFFGGANLVAQWEAGTWRLPFQVAMQDAPVATIDTREVKEEQEATKKKPKNKEKISPINPKSLLERNTSGQDASGTSDSMLSEDLSQQTQERLSTGEREAVPTLVQPQRSQATKLLPRFSAIEIAPDGTTVVLGFSAPGAVVRVFLDGREISTALVGTDGRWATALARTLAPGDHRLNAIGADLTGEVAHGRVVEFSVPTTNDGAYRIALDQDEVLESKEPTFPD